MAGEDSVTTDVVVDEVQPTIADAPTGTETVANDEDELEVDSESNPLVIRKSVDGEPEQAKGGALSAGEPIDIWTMEYFGYLPQYFVVGIIYGGLPSTTYGFFLG